MSDTLLSKPLRVLFLIPGLPDGNSMVFARRQAESLVAQGLAVEVFDLRSRISPRVLWREFLRFRRMLGTFRPQVIHAHYGTMTAMFAVLASGKLPLMITYRGSDLNPLPSARKLRPAAGRLLSQLAALRASRIVCVSPQLRDRLWWGRDRATVLPSGVDAEVFKLASQRDMRLRLGWQEQDRIVLFNAGGDGPNKRLDLAQAATGEARRWEPALRLEVLDGTVPPDRIPAMMNAADCLLVTSDAEGSPTVVQEALATNLPIVSVDVGDIAERLEGVAYSRIARRDAQSLGRALADVVTPPRRSDGRRRVAEFSSQRIARELGRLYRDIARPSVAAQDI
jgi:teichuronic acid biosynthesis glycosyltransferase TuaC